MARSKRSSSSSAPKGSKKARKLDTITTIRNLLPTHRHLYLFQLANVRSAFFQRVRLALAPTTTFFVGKNKVLQKAIAESSEAGNEPALAEFASKITHNTGVAVSSLERVDFEDQLATALQGMCDYARAGSIAPFSVSVDVDPTSKALVKMDSGEPVSATVEPVLRAAGMPTMLRGGQVLLANGESSFEVVKAGERVNVEQAKILRIFGIKTDDFNVRLLEHFAVNC